MDTSGFLGNSGTSPASTGLTFPASAETALSGPVFTSSEEPVDPESSLHRTRKRISASGRIPSVEYRILLCHAMCDSRTKPDGAMRIRDETSVGNEDVKEAAMPPPRE